MKASDSASDSSPKRRIDDYVASLDDWRGDLISQLRTLVLETDPGAVEEWKWSTPVWSHDGLLCAAAAFKDHVKFTFFSGVSLSDPTGLFNAGLDAKTMRSIDFRQGDHINAPGLESLVRAAVTHNLS